MQKVNMEIARDIMGMLPTSKQIALDNACGRNFMMTSSYELENMVFTVYKEGFMIELQGCRSAFRVFAKDNDGKLEITRKPNENKLHKIYDEWAKTDWVFDIEEYTKAVRQ